MAQRRRHAHSTANRIPARFLQLVRARGVSGKADPLRDPVGRRRLGGRADAHPHPAALGADERGVRGREQARRLVRARYDGHRQSAARRLHHRLRQPRLARHQQAAARLDPVRRREGPHADLELRARVQPARGEQQAPGRQRAGAHRLREEEPGQAHHRLLGQRHHRAPRRGALQGDDRDRHRPRPLQGQPAGDQRPDGGADRHDVRQHLVDRAARQVRAREGHRGLRPAALAGVPGPADDRRGGRAGLRDRGLGRRDRAGEIARRGRFEVEPGNQESARGAQRARALQAARHRARRRHAGGVHGAGEARDAEMGGGDPALGAKVD